MGNDRKGRKEPRGNTRPTVPFSFIRGEGSLFEFAFSLGRGVEEVTTPIRRGENSSDEAKRKSGKSDRGEIDVYPAITSAEEEEEVKPDRRCGTFSHKQIGGRLHFLSSIREEEKIFGQQPTIASPPLNSDSEDRGAATTTLSNPTACPPACCLIQLSLKTRRRKSGEECGESERLTVNSIESIIISRKREKIMRTSFRRR